MKKYSNENLSIFFNIYIMYSLYVLKDPNTLIVRYVGYSKNPKRRLWEHIRDAKKGVKTHKSNWIKSLIDSQQTPLIEVVYNSNDYDDILSKEIELIKELKDNGILLTNLTNGGDGQRGRKLDRNHPIINYNLGKKMSDESKIKLSESRKGIVFSDEHRNKLSIKKIGHKRSLESIEKQSLTKSCKIKVLYNDDVFIFSKKSDAVKFTGVNSKQIDKLIENQKKSKKGYFFIKLF